MKEISIIIITLNEEHNIERCLSSIINLSDDIIVIDSGSNDRTLEICKNFENVKVIFNEFTDYASQRNFGTEQAKYNFILNIDADEALSSELNASISKIEISEHENTLFTFNRLNHYCNKPIRFGGWYPDKRRKFWNKKFAKWHGIVHESLDFNNNPPIVVHLQGDLLHYTYMSTSEHIEQSVKYAILSGKNDFAKGKKTNIIKLLFKPLIKFYLIYIFKLSFLNGFKGFMIAAMSSISDFLRNVVLLSIRKNK